MTLYVENDRQNCGRRKRSFNSFGESTSRPSATAGLPFTHGSRFSSKRIPVWHSTIRTVCLIVLPLLYFLGTIVTLRLPPWQRGGVWGFGSGKEFIPLLDAPPAWDGVEGAAIKNIGIVAACRNRHELLKATLPSWLRLPGVQEIVLVDWTSSPPLTETIAAVLNDKRLRTVRVRGEAHWVLSRAYNLAMAVAESEWIIRVDCDCRIKDGFINAHLGQGRNGTKFYNPSPKRFWSGYWQKARDGNEVHLNGAMLVRRADFLQAGGYDERIQTYGWDDEELFTRLARTGLKRYVLDYDQLEHVPHEDGLRNQNGVAFPDVNIDFNSLLLERLPEWKGMETKMRELTGMPLGHQNGLQVSRYERTFPRDAPSRHISLNSLTRPPSAADLVLAEEKADAWNLALGRRLHNTYGLCWDLMTHMDVSQRETLLRNLVALAPDANHQDEVPRLMVVHVMHGLGNRLRALGSALAFARSTRRAAVIIWEADRHCEARFSDLFETSTLDGSELVAVDGIGVSWPFTSASQYDASWMQWETYNYMQREGSGAEKDAEIAGNSSHNIYFKAAYVMHVQPHGLTGWDSANKELRKLRAVQPVRGVVEDVKNMLDDSIGVHVRHLATKRDISAVDARSEYGEIEQTVIDYWRNASDPAVFVSGVKDALTELTSRGTPRSRIFVAADSAEWAASLSAALPGATWGLGTSADARLGCAAEAAQQRSAGCLRRALADLLCLARTRVVLGSMWSSFSEAAGRLGAAEVRLAGVDFGAEDDVTEIAVRYGAGVADAVAGVRRWRERRRAKQEKKGGKAAVQD